MKAKIRLTNRNHEINCKELTLKTIYCDVIVPLSKVIISDGVAVVPDRYFHDNEINPCHMINGFISMV